MSEDFDDLEEPVPCPCCQEWVELQETYPCRNCQALVCPSCLVNGECEYCRDALTLSPVRAARRREKEGVAA